MKSIALSIALFSLTLPLLAQYSATQDGDVVRLEDAKSQTVVSVMPSRGNNAFQMTVKGKNVLYYPFKTPAEFKRRGLYSGIPFLGPWANRLDEMAFYANGKKYLLNGGLGNVQGPIPMHGFLMTAAWEVVEAKADANSAWVTSRIEVYKQPDMMAQFPFAHTVEMTHRLKDGVLEVSVKLNNLSTAPMPASVGFHPYFQVNDAPRDEWTFSVAAKTHWIGKQNLPTGEKEPISNIITNAAGESLKGVKLDDVFGDLIRDDSGKATMWVQGKTERVEVTFGPKFRAMCVYFPAGRGQDYICFEPMAGITDAMNMAQKGQYDELQSIPPGGTWQESFWVKPSGF